MSNLTRAQQRERFLAEFLRCLREVPPGTKVYMAAGDLFKDADVQSPKEQGAARRHDRSPDDDDNEPGDVRH